MRAVRIILVLAAVVVAGIGIAVAATSSYTDQSDAIETARAIGEMNEDSAESAPQQQVVNGWLAADLLEIQAQQLNDIGKNQNTTNLMLGLIGAVAALGFLAVALQSRPPQGVSTTSAASTPMGAVAVPEPMSPDVIAAPVDDAPSSFSPPPPPPSPPA